MKYFLSGRKKVKNEFLNVAFGRDNPLKTAENESGK